MHTNSFQRQGDPVEVGWSIGHTPLWLRGIRLVEGEGSAAPGAGQEAAPAPAAGANPPAPAPPQQVAAFYAAQNGSKAPPTAPTPQPPRAPTAPPGQQVEGVTRSKCRSS